MNVKPIRTTDDHKAALARIEEIFEAKPGSVEYDELDVLTTLVEAYERAHYPIALPISGVHSIRLLADVHGLKIFFVLATHDIDRDAHIVQLMAWFGTVLDYDLVPLNSIGMIPSTAITLYSRED